MGLSHGRAIQEHVWLEGHSGPRSAPGKLRSQQQRGTALSVDYGAWPSEVGITESDAGITDIMSPMMGLLTLKSWLTGITGLLSPKPTSC